MKMLSNRTGGFLPALILAVMLVLGLSAQKAHAQDYYDDYGNGDYQEFYDDLSPYGQWLNDPQYGYVWVPNVGNDFRPYYTNGRWAMTEYGNTWVSDYNWGWAPFHYGRWAQGSYGWIWIPGNEWGPAWVNWRQGGGYYGWAPMGPGISINISFGGGYNVPNPWWTFIPCGNIYTPGWQRYYSPRRTVNIINNTTIINNTYVDNRTRNRYVTGPRRTEIEAATRQRVNVYNVTNRTRAGATNISGRSVNVYRPSIERTSGRTQVAPRQVKTLERSAITNTGGGRAPSRPMGIQQQGNRIDRATQMREAQRTQQNARPGVQRDQQQQSRVQQATRQRDVQMQREQQVQQQRGQRDQQQQRVQQAEQQRNVQIQREQQMQQQRVQRDQQQQRIQQAEQQRNVQMQRDQQVQQQRVQRDQQQRVQQAEQQRNVQMQQREQQVQQRQQMQQQRSVERAQPQQRIERSAPAPQQQRIERSAPEQRSTERSRGR
jgi:hypothetical protein